MGKNLIPNPVGLTKDSYDSRDEDNFYFNVWGGEDIHIGIYGNINDSIREASRKTVSFMENFLTTGGAKVLDLSSGYGGSARYLAEKYRCHVNCLNINNAQNKWNKEINIKTKLGKLIDVDEGNFEEIPYPDNSFDIVWSQDAILHSNNKHKVFSEVFRALKNGGEFVFSDPMQTGNCPEEVLQQVLERTHSKSLGSPMYYIQIALEVGFKNQKYIDLSSHLTIHYIKVLDELIQRQEEISSFCSKKYINRMVQELQHWIHAGHKGYLKWGVLYFTKPD